jgi:uncharacterized protein YndB with AHSA1/START domain
LWVVIAMVEVQGEIVIDRRPEDVFDFVADEENEPQYSPQMRLAKKLTEGPIGVGTSFRAEMTGRGRVVPMTIQFTEFDRPRRLEERVQMKAMDLTGGLTFEPVDGATRMRWSWNLEPPVSSGSWPGRGRDGAAAGEADLDEPQAASRGEDQVTLDLQEMC